MYKWYQMTTLCGTERCFHPFRCIWHTRTNPQARVIPWVGKSQSWKQECGTLRKRPTCWDVLSKYVYSTSKPMVNLGTVGFTFRWPFPSGTPFRTKHPAALARLSSQNFGRLSATDLSPNVMEHVFFAQLILFQDIKFPPCRTAPWRELLFDWWDAHLKIFF